MRRTVNIGKSFGVRQRLHYTWFPALVLLAAALAVYFQGDYSLLQGILLGISASLLFTASMIAREVARSYVAVRRHLSIRSITLYVFGGVHRITEEDAGIVSELMIAATGILSSVIIAGIFYIAYAMLASVGMFMAAELMQWLAYFNIMIALFNLIPGLPLDGGRILRAVLWMRTGNFNRATLIAAFIGWGIGLALIVGGIVFIIVTRGWYTGLAMIFSGWILENASRNYRKQQLIREALRGITSRYMMTENYTTIKKELTFTLVRDYIVNSGQHCFVVVEDGELMGILTLHDIQIPEKLWDSTLISSIMTSIDKLEVAYPDEPVAYLLEQMDESNIKQIPVLEGGKIVGMVEKYKIIRFLRARAVLKA